ncbi:MAG: VOC family protein [Herbinix sp.]|nr:VOC family protein [Herbinix sp.]
MKIITQLCFAGTSDEALKLYERAFGCTVKTLIHYRDAVAYGWEKPNEEINDRVYHSEIMFGDYEVRLIDLDNSEKTELTQKVTMYVGFDTEEDVRNVYSVLAEEGIITRELTCPPYMVIIGEVRDKFGVTWSLMCDF